MAINKINAEKCTGCGTCINACPMDVFRRDINQVEVPPCAEACPAHVDMRTYMDYVKAQRYDEAIQVILKTNPLFAITGRVCYHKCESACARQYVDAAVNINGVERYLGDLLLETGAKKANTIYAAKIAVIGSGPAGLAAAYDLTVKGYPVTVFESDEQLGGMLRTAIPEYRLPTEVLDKQIQYLRDTGVEFRTGTALGRDICLDCLKQDGYAAVLIATGAPASRKADIPGAELSGVVYGLDFVKAVKRGDATELGEKVVVIGGGNVAVDAALCAKKSGAGKVTVVYRRSRGEMPASAEEIRMAEEEGVEVLCGWAPFRVDGSGHVTGATFIRNTSTPNVFGHSGITLDESNQKTLAADTVIFALGEETDLSVLPQELHVGADSITVDPITMATNLPGVFAAGTVGPKSGSVTEAIGSAMQAAISIDRYIKNEDLAAGRGGKSKKVKHPPKEGVALRPRHETEELAPAERTGNFCEIKHSYDRQTADCEANRCMACGSKSVAVYTMDCQCCEACEWDCPNGAIFVSPEKKQDIPVYWR